MRPTSQLHQKKTSIILLATTAAFLGACSGNQPFVNLSGINPLSSNQANNMQTGGGAKTNIAGNRTPDSRGVITYETYQVAVARSGDTVASVAARVGIDAQRLAVHNGLSTGTQLRAGEILALPSYVPPVATNSRNSETIKTETLDDEPVTDATTAETVHTVKAGETVFSISRLYGVSVTALAAWNNLGADMIVREGQELKIPTGETPNSDGQKLTEDDTATASTAPAPTSSTPNFSEPVSGSITTTYNAAPGPNHSDGIVYSTGSGASVKAAGAGTVALVSKSAGNEGNIVLIKHDNGLITVYGRLGTVNVTKGQAVSAGQVIGATANDSLLFQVRRGTESLNPVEYF